MKGLTDVMPSHPKPSPPYLAGTRYRAVPVTLARSYATIVASQQRGYRYVFALPNGWLGYYEIPNGQASHFLDALPSGSQPFLITFTVAHVTPETAELTLHRPRISDVLSQPP